MFHPELLEGGNDLLEVERHGGLKFFHYDFRLAIAEGLYRMGR